MNRYIRQSLCLLNTIRKKIGQQICDRLAARLRDFRKRTAQALPTRIVSFAERLGEKKRQVLDQRKPPQPDVPPREADSSTEIARKAAEEQKSEQSTIASIAKSNRNNERHCNKRRKSKRAQWAEEKSKQDSAYAEAKANGDNEGVRDYWKWIKRYGASTKEYYARAKAKRKAAQKIAERNNQTIGDEARKRRAEIKADAQCKLPEDIMIEHLEDHRDGIGWSIAALAKKRFHIRRILKINDPNGDMFCEVEDQGESLLKAVKQLISEHNR